MKKRIFYWSPYLGRVATIRSVINSMIGLSNFKKKFSISLIDCYGEWDSHFKNLKENKINIYKLQNKIKFKIDSYGFLLSRCLYFFTLIFSYKKLKKILNKNKPEYLIVHLLTFIPLLLFLNNNFKTKLILRISGKPKFTLFRLLLWKISNKNIHLVFCPTKETMNYLAKKKVFKNSKIKFLPDPVIYKKEIKKLSRIKNKIKLKKNSYYLSIGRLTKQKNHELLINFYAKKKPSEKLLIIGNGELLNHLKKLIENLKLDKKIIMLNYQKNIFSYIKGSKCVLIPSLWEDPGFVMIESAYLKKTIICSDCPSGSKEFINRNKGGFLFKSNSLTSFEKAFNKFNESNKKTLIKKINYSKNKSKIYSLENHTKLITKYLI